MNNFSYYNPVDVHFGKGTIAELPKLISPEEKILLLYGGGSIMSNGVYDQVITALAGRDIVEFGGVEANPDFDTCLKAVETIREQGRDFILAVGGGSVLDAAKFIASVVKTPCSDPWKILTGEQPVDAALPLGSVMTLPATGSEMNNNAVISRRETMEKLAMSNRYMFPRFSILDPETTLSLPPRQVANGIVDSFVHVIEQYLTYPVNSPVQDRSAEGVLLTLIEEGPRAMHHPKDYPTRANLFWASTIALNKLLGVGVPQDWATHAIGHELTALYGIDHARTLAVVLPGLMSHKRDTKREKLLQYAERVWGVDQGDEEVRIDEAIARTILFFEDLGVPTTLGRYETDGQAPERVAGKFVGREKIGEHADIGPEDVRAILTSRA